MKKHVIFDLHLFFNININQYLNNLHANPHIIEIHGIRKDTELNNSKYKKILKVIFLFLYIMYSLKWLVLSTYIH